MITIKHIQFIHVLGSVTMLALVTLLGVLLLPVVGMGANAEVTPFADSAAFGLDINAESVVSIGINNPEGIDITPKAGGSTNTQNATVTVTTNNKDGYKMYLQTTDSNNQLSNVSVSTTDKINSISSTTGVALDSTGFEQNAWGYSFSQGTVTDEAAKNLLYRGIPAASTPIVPNGVTSADGTLTSATGVDTYTLSFGAKVNPSIAAGKYSTQVIVSAVANPVAVTDLNTLTYMQDMTPDICKNTKGTDGNATVTAGKEPTRRLIDTRDGNVYWVSKLADQNCWMVQNLAYDITASRIENDQINWTNTDLGENQVWNKNGLVNKATGAVISTYAPTPTETQVPAAESSPSNTGTRSWNLGKYVLATPTTGVTCNSAPTPDSPNNDGYNSVRPGQSLSQCKNTVDVSDPAWKPTYESKEGTWTTPDGSGTVDTLVSVDPNTKTYDAHYLLGRWYQWNTATAGTGGTLVSPSTSEPVNAPSSICPKGWQLPSSEMNTKSLDPKYGQTFYKLFTNYGYKFDNTDGGGRIYGPNEQNGYNVATAPFYFTRSGIIDVDAGSAKRLGHVSDYWLNVPRLELSYAYFQDSNNTFTYPTYYYTRTYGCALRCLVTNP